ncbi:MAG TPA: NAD-dependent epimerase/dehydratase family protein, partial [Panacibacter sp.]|nr:NAD-dependent epimerase/dehydratase family protein [Panacibacter sp.]
ATVTVWGSGKPLREFLHADDMADACVFLMLRYNDEGLVNIGRGTDITIAGLAGIVKEVTGFKGDIIFDSSRPDGTPRKLMDVSKLNALGWRYKIELEHGIAEVYRQHFAVQ